MIIKQYNRNWLIGYRIAAEEIGNADRAEYGTEEELKAEIETQKAMFYLQNKDDEKQT